MNYAKGYMKGILTHHVFWDINDYKYSKGSIVCVAELRDFPECYAVYANESLDWLPKESVEIIE